MIINDSAKFRIETQSSKLKHKQGAIAPKTETLLSTSKKSQYNYQDIKRPLKTNHQDLSFKGLSLGLYRQLEKTYSVKEFLEFSDKYIGKMGRELFEDITQKHGDKTNKLIKIDGDKIIINKKTIPHLALDGMLYPFKVLPGDMLNGLVELMGKIPGLKNTSENILQTQFFKNIRQRSKLDSKIDSLTGLITYRDVKNIDLNKSLKDFAEKTGKGVDELTQEEVAKVSEEVEKKLQSSIFQSELRMFDPKSGNYDTKHERSLNRLVSGLPPAIFLANDAYNLSRMMDDDSKEAEKERKTRFKQEASRIISNAYLTLITLGAFQSFINKSKAGIVITTGATVLVTEMLSRLSNGKHITRLTPEQARKENERLNTPEAKIKPIETKNISSTGSLPVNGPKKEQQKPLLSFGTVMKASLAVLTTGYGLKGLKKLPAVQKAAMNYFEKVRANHPEHFEKLGIKELSLENAVENFQSKVLFKPFTDLYKNMTSEKFLVEEDRFNKVVDVLRENGFEKLADKYTKIIASAQKSNEAGKVIIDLGKKDKKIKPLVDFVIAPFKFMWNTVTLPYWMIDEKLMSVFRKAKPKSGSSDLSTLAKSFERIYKQAAKENFNPEAFKDFIQVNRLKGFNVDSLSSVSNAELSNLAKTAATIATIWFLMTDNYNMVMMKSNGNDKHGAETKFKERFVQEGSRLFYQTLLIDLFNSTFRNQYNSSLLGMSLITVTNTTLGEMLTRKSVGTPIKAHTRDELIDIETKQNNSTGFVKKYYNFMQRLTGKRAIKTYEVASKNKQNQSASLKEAPLVRANSIPSLSADKRIIFAQNNAQTLNQMIKG